MTFISSRKGEKLSPGTIFLLSVFSLSGFLEICVKVRLSQVLYGKPSLFKSSARRNFQFVNFCALDARVA